MHPSSDSGSPRHAPQSLPRAGRVLLDDVVHMPARTEHQTIVGPIRFQGSENATIPGSVGQWQNGEFVVVWPKSLATAQLAMPKPQWK